jgi:transcriptional regulator NrdR family protein
MFCPKCSNEDTKVTETENGMIRKRARKCEACGFRFFTIEAIESDSMWQQYKIDCVKAGLLDNHRKNN